MLADVSMIVNGQVKGMAEKEHKSEPLGLRITPSLKKALEKAAEEEGRSIADYVQRSLAELLKQKGFLK